MGGLKMEMVKRGKKGIWTVKFWLGGKKVFKTTGMTDKRKAEAWAKTHVEQLTSTRNAVELAETVRKIRSGGSRMKFSEAWEAFVRMPRRVQVSQERIEACKSWWGDFEAWCRDEHQVLEVQHVTGDMAREYIGRLPIQGRHLQEKVVRSGKTMPCVSLKLSSRTINIATTLMRRIFEAAWERLGMSGNPFAKIPVVAQDNVSREAFTKNQLKEMMEAAKGDPLLEPLLVAGLYTGLRLGDMATLDWKEVDLKRQIIRKLTSKTGVVVTIPILPPLRRYLEVLPERSGPVFPELHAKYTGGHRISHGFKRLLKQLGIESQRDMGDGKRARSTHDIHSLRHTFVWLAADAGVPLPVVQSVVGHLSQEMTQHYANHATEAAKLLHLGRLPDLFGDKKAAQSPDELLALVRGRLADANKGNSWAVIQELRTLL